MIIGIINMQRVSFMRPVFKEEEFKRMVMSVSLMIGDHEILYEPLEALDSASRLIPGLQAELIPSANHMLNSDQAELINARILQFLKDD